MRARLPRGRPRVALAAVAVAAAGALLAVRGEPAAARPGPAAGTPAPPPPPEARPEPAPGAAPVAVAPPAVATVAAPAEDALMERLRADVDANPERALAVADEGEARFPDGRHGDERAFLRMRALVHLDRIGIAREAARAFFERYPESPLGRLVFRLTGMRPAPRLGPPR